MQSVFKMGATDSKPIDLAKEVQFTLHGELHTVKASSDITAETSLNSYLRNNAGLRGTKGMCYEGGCGSCVVAVTIKHPVTKKERTFAINSCLIPILSCHGWTINTIEGIGNRKNGYHAIQEVLAKFSGSQCGFCSGGMVMNMYALYNSNDMLTMKDVENAFGGNLCRCTGYRPIMDAFKSLTSDADPGLFAKFPDIEDLRICAKTGKQCNNQCKVMPLNENRFWMKLRDEKNWYKVYSIQDILELFHEIGDDSYRFVAGNTGKGVYKIDNKPKYWIDILSVPELITHKLNKDLILGANTSLTDTMEIIKKVAEENSNFWYLKKIYNHIDVVANVPVRNFGTLAGNLSLKHAHKEFPSDIFLLLNCINAQLTIVDKSGSTVTKSMVDYLQYDMNKCLIKTITISPYEKDKYLFESYKICPRVQNAHAYVNAAFLVEHDKFVVKSARIIFGGIAPDFLHAGNTEKYLVGKNLIDNATLQGALDELNKEIKPDYVLPDATPEFRKNLALALFYKFVLASAPADKVNPKFASGGTRLERELSFGKQEFQTNEKMYPLTQPIQKLEGVIQCSGEAQYVNDMPSISGELYGAFVLAEAKPFSKITNVDTSEALKMPGVRAFIDHKDIPGVNNFSPPPFAPNEEQLFCVDTVKYNGQPIGVIVASTEEQAIEAAKLVKVTYKASSDVPCYTVEDVLKNKQTNRIKNLVNIQPKKKGDKIKHVIKGKIEMGPQYHFSMETQSCICIPTEDGGLDMYPASQWINHVQMTAARALNIPMNKINIFVKRLGGAYGCKIIRASLVSTACAVAAYKLNKPVRLHLPLTDNMKAVGKRTPNTSDYEVGVDDDGVIQYLKITYYQASGQSGLNEQATTYMPFFFQNSYNNDTWELNGNMLMTDMPGNAYARAPGSTEAIATIETIIEHISYVLNKDPVKIKQANLAAVNFGMSDFIKETVASSEYEDRLKKIEDFNSKNRWMKKGLSFVIMAYPFEILGPFSVFLSVFAGDGTVAISHGGIECGQGINTKVAQVCAHVLNIPIEMVSVKDSTSLNSPNNFATGGSATSEGVCYGTMQTCQEILKRLEPIKKEMKNATWKELVMKAFASNIELCATYMYSKKSDVKPYMILGTCVCEVTCDILTGEHNIDRVDILEDVGQSMSPKVDVGQIEGAFIMGLGYYTCEQLIHDENGKMLTNSTWTYKVPGVKDIPVDFRVKFKQDSTNPQGVFNSKATAEPPLCMSVVIPLAIRKALAAARKDADEKADTFVPIKGPTTVEYKFLNSLNDYKKYSL